MNIICEQIKKPKENKITIDDVFVSMKVFSSYNKDTYFNDEVPYKSITVKCNKKQYDNVRYCLEYVLGVNCIHKTKNIDNDNMVIRANYMCW